MDIDKRDTIFNAFLALVVFISITAMLVYPFIAVKDDVTVMPEVRVLKIKEMTFCCSRINNTMLLNEIANMNIMTINNVSDIKESIVMSQRYLTSLIKQLEEEPNHYRKQASLKIGTTMFINTFNDAVKMLENEDYPDTDLLPEIESLLEGFKDVYNIAVQEDDPDRALVKLKQIQTSLDSFEYF